MTHKTFGVAAIPSVLFPEPADLLIAVALDFVRIGPRWRVETAVADPSIFVAVNVRFAVFPPFSSSDVQFFVPSFHGVLRNALRFWA